MTETAATNTRDAMPVAYLSHGAPPLADDATWTAEFAGWGQNLPTQRHAHRPASQPEGATMTDIEQNKKVVLDYYQTAFSGNPEKAIADHFGPRYVQHNPDAQDGPEAFIGFVTWLRGEYPNLQLHFKRVIAEGDMVVTHAHLDLEPGNPENPGRALADFFRLEDGKVVEHWDVIQDVPLKAANDNGMF